MPSLLKINGVSGNTQHEQNVTESNPEDNRDFIEQTDPEGVRFQSSSGIQRIFNRSTSGNDDVSRILPSSFDLDNNPPVRRISQTLSQQQYLSRQQYLSQR